jgi:hypothetical protein
MKQIVKLTEKDLTKLIQRVINESDIVYGSEEIEKLRPNLKDDEDIQLDDSSGELSGMVSKKIDIVKNRLKRALKNKDWNEVMDTLLYLDLKL